MIYYDTFESPIGPLLLTGDGRGLTGLYLENHKRGPAVAQDWVSQPELFATASLQMKLYFEGKLTQFDLPLKLEGTNFQKEVWDLLAQIPFGATTTYGELARRLGNANASRAVGAAVGLNPISIIVPCHRVVGHSGAITGYAGGVAKKEILLRLEGALEPALLVHS